MDSSKELYVVIGYSVVDPKLSYGEALRSTMAVATNFKKAYNLALEIGQISDPRLGYKAALERSKEDYAVRLEDQDGSVKSVIVRVKKW